MKKFIIKRHPKALAWLEYLKDEGVWLVCGGVAMMSWYEGQAPIIDANLPNHEELKDLIWALRQLLKYPEPKLVHKL